MKKNPCFVPNESLGKQTTETFLKSLEIVPNSEVRHFTRVSLTKTTEITSQGFFYPSSQFSKLLLSCRFLCPNTLIFFPKNFKRKPLKSYPPPSPHPLGILQKTQQSFNTCEMITGSIIQSCIV